MGLSVESQMRASYSVSVRGPGAMFIAFDAKDDAEALRLAKMLVRRRVDDLSLDARMRVYKPDGSLMRTRKITVESVYKELLRSRL